MNSYIRKLKEVKAIQWTGKNVEEIDSFLKETKAKASRDVWVKHGLHLRIKNQHMIYIIEKKQWITVQENEDIWVYSNSQFKKYFKIKEDICFIK